MPDLDPARLRDALAASEQEERAATDLEREAQRLFAVAAQRRARWGLPPRGRERPEFKVAK